MTHLGTFYTTLTRTHVTHQFSTHAAAGGNVAPSSGFEAADIRIYRAALTGAYSATQRSSASGITMTSPFDSLTGYHDIDIDLTDNTDSGFYAAGYRYLICLAPDETVDSQTITGIPIATFEIGSLPAPLTFYVGKGGSDSNDGLTWATRKLTIAGAVEGTLGGALAVAAISNTKTRIFIGPGSFDEPNKLNLRVATTNGIDLIGSGMDSTFINSTCTLTDPGATKTNVYRGCGVAMGTGSVVEDLTINGLAVGDGAYFGVGQNNSFDSAASSWTMRRVRILSDSDGIYDRYQTGAGDDPAGIGQNILVEDCIITTKWHAVRIFGSWQRIILRRCIITVSGPTAIQDATNTEDQACPIALDGGTVIVEDCTLVGLNGETTTYGVDVRSTGLVELYGNTSIRTSSATGTVLDLNGTVNVYSAHYDPAKTSGPVTVIAAQGVNVTQVSGDSTAADNLEAFTDGTGYAGGTIKLGVDAVRISGDSTAADNLESQFDGTGLSGATYPARQDAEGSGGGAALAEDVWNYATRKLTSGPAIVTDDLEYEEWTIVKGNSYSSTNQPKIFTMADRGPTDLSTYTWAFTAEKNVNNLESGDASFTGTVTVTTATGASRAVRVDLPATTTDSLALGKYDGAIRGTASSEKATPKIISITVVDDPNQA